MSNKANRFDSLITLSEAAAMIGVTSRSLYTWRTKGWIHFIKFGGRTRISLKEVHLILSEGTERPEEAAQ